jgi:hypothetical protein
VRHRLLACALALALAGTTSAQDERPAGDSLVRATREAIRIGTTKDGAARVQLLLDAAGDRLTQLDGSKEPALRDALAASYDKLTNAALGVIENGVAQGKNMDAAVERYTQAVGKHTPALERAVAKTPADGRERLSRALDGSRRGHEDALAAHQRGKERAAHGAPAATPPPHGRDAKPAPRPSPPPAPQGHGRPAPSPKPGGHDGGKGH